MQGASVKNGNRDTFYRTLIVLAMPMVLQNVIDSAVGMADTVMLGYISQSALAATSLANNIQMVANLLFYGLCSGSSVLISQYWGRRDLDTIERTIGISLRFSLSSGFIFFIAAFFFPDVLMTFYTTDAELILQGTKYIRIVGICYLTGAFTQIYIASQRAMERVLFGTVTNMIALFLNVILNACYIFGLWFFPALGITGVAYATVISRLVSLCICLVDAMWKGHEVRVRIRYLWARKKELFRDYIKYTLPALGNDFSWGFGFSMYSVILGHISSDIVAANSYAGVVRSLSTVICFAIANAAGVMLGKTLGQNKLDTARVYGRRFLVLSIVFGVLGGACIAVAAPYILQYVATVDVTKEALDLLRFMLIISTVNVVGQSVNTMLICGVFRAGGDTKFGFILDTVTMWGYGVAIGMLLAFVFKVPPRIVYLYLFMDEIVKMPANFVRYRKKLWVRNITRDMKVLT